MLQRIGLAQAMMNDPDLIVLDEPTDGVDPLGRRDIRDVLLRLRERGKTVFINSHLLSELEMISDRVAILVLGRVARQGTIEELTREQQRYEIELVSADPGNGLRSRVSDVFGRLGTSLREKRAAALSVAPPSPAMDAMRWQIPPAPPRFAVDAGEMADGVWVELEGPWIRIGTAEAERVQPILDALRSAGLTIRRLVPIRQTLEDLFMRAVIPPAQTPTVHNGDGGARP